MGWAVASTRRFARRFGLVRLAVVVALGAGACSQSSDAVVPDSSVAPTAVQGTNPTTTSVRSDAPAPSAVTNTSPVAAALPSGNARPASCEPGPGAEPWADLVTVQSREIYSDDELSIRAVRYPHPDREVKLWSQWGQGIVTAQGTFVSAIGDHNPVEGNSYLYEYDPLRGELTMFSDLFERIGLEPGDSGFGKVHAQMVPGPCGDVYLTTYWGRRKDVQYSDTYRGDHLLRIDPAARVIEDLGVLHEAHGVPSLAGWSEGGFIYGEAVDPRFEENQGSLIVYDTAAREVVAAVDDVNHIGFRALAVDAAGRALYSIGGGRLAAIDPVTLEIGEISGRMPGDWLRAATAPTGDGTVYGVSRDPEKFFAVTPGGDITVIGEARGYTTSVVVSPDEAELFYVPYAHGAAYEWGTPLLAVDVETGAERVVAELNPIAERELGLKLGGTYNLAVDSANNRLYVGLNGAALDHKDAWGEIVLFVIDFKS